MEHNHIYGGQILAHIKTLINAILAGVCISIGGTVFVASDVKIVGALLFCVGLMTICVYQMALFTGKVGYILQNKPIYLVECLITWAGNLLGTVLCGWLVGMAKPELAQKATAIFDAKIAQTPLQSIILGFFCGILMYIAVDNFRTNSHTVAKYIGIFVCVPAFIMAGFEHSIADMYYFALAEGMPMLSLRGVVYILYVSLGNILGGLLIPNLKLLGEKVIKK